MRTISGSVSRLPRIRSFPRTSRLCPFATPSSLARTRLWTTASARVACLKNLANLFKREFVSRKRVDVSVSI